jgi:DNA polymerase IV (DinB-like DNA polymerase)
MDTLEIEHLVSRLKEMAGDVFRRLGEEGFESFRTVVLTVRFADFETRSKSTTAKAPMTAFEELFATGLRLLLPFLDARLNPKLKKIVCWGCGSKLDALPISS